MKAILTSALILAGSALAALWLYAVPQTTAIGPFGSRVPFGGPISFVCSCTCSGETLWRIGRPSAYTWPEDRSETFLTGGYTDYYLKDRINPGEWTVGMAREPKSTCTRLVCTPTGCRCVPCGSGYPIQYIGTDSPQTGFGPEQR